MKKAKGESCERFRNESEEGEKDNEKMIYDVEA